MKEMQNSEALSLLAGSYGSLCVVEGMKVSGKVDYNAESNSGNKNIVIENCVFDDDFIIYFPDAISATIKIINSTFKQTVQFKNLGGSVDIENCIFEDDFLIHGRQVDLLVFKIQTHGKIKLTGTFNKVNIIEATRVESGKEPQFYFTGKVSEELLIEACSFVNTFFLILTCNCPFFIQNSRFSFTSNHRALTISACTFAKHFRLNQCTIDGEFFVSDTVVDGTTTVVKISCNGLSEFSSITFKEKAIFDYSIFQKLNFYQCDFLQNASFKYAEIDILEYYKTVFSNGTDFLGANIKSGDRETFRIIKNEFSKINNQVEALHYGAKEMTAYEKEVWDKKKYGDYILLFLNRTSNLHNQSWIRGVVFTLLTGIGFYAIYLFTLTTIPFHWGWHGWSGFWQASGTNIKYFIRFFIITHDIDFMKDYRPTAASFIADFVGKIFIGYGIYQTVQAFRKHGKG